MKVKKTLLATVSGLALISGAQTLNAQNAPANSGTAGPAAEAPSSAPAASPNGSSDPATTAPSGPAQENMAPEPGQHGMDRSRDSVEQRTKDGDQPNDAKQVKNDRGDGEGKRDKSDRASGAERENKKNADADRKRSGGDQKSAKVNVDETKKASLKKKVDRGSLKRTDVDISVNVGVAVPSSVTLYTLPPTWVTVVPEYEGYEYIYVDGAICIVDPGTLLIVDVIYV